MATITSAQTGDWNVSAMADLHGASPSASAAVNGAALAACFAELAAGGALTIPPGIYTTDRGFAVPSHVRINMHGATIRATQ
jgi:polygalacturonase